MKFIERLREIVESNQQVGIDPLAFHLEPADPTDLRQVEVAEQLEAKLKDHIAIIAKRKQPT